MNHVGRFAFVAVVVVLGEASPARALCIAPPDPSVFCGAGATAVVAHAVDDQDGAPVDGVVVVVDEIGGAPMAGLAVGDELALGPATDAVTIGLGIAVDTQTVFVLRDFGTWTRAAPVVEGRAWIDDDGAHTIADDDVLALVALDDQQTCIDQSNDQVEPQIYKGPCNDELGCAAMPASLPMATVLCALLRRRRRR